MFLNPFLRYARENKLLVTAAVVTLGLAFFIFLAPQMFFDLIERYSIAVREVFGTFYLYLGLGCVLFLLIIAFSGVGKKRLGNTPPEFSFLSWLAMLYSAGMGAGILLRAVQEPVFMQQNPPIKTSLSPDSIALEYTFYQWGLTAWAFYVFFALVIGYYFFIKKRKILLSSGFSEKERTSGINIVDLLTVLTTVIGIVAAIGLGAQQIEGGIKYFFDLKTGYFLAFIFTFLIFLLSFFSAYRGLNRGIKHLSNINIVITLLLLGFVFFQGNAAHILTQFFVSLYHYLIDFVPLSLALGKYNPGKVFLTDWTYYYWAFWLAWGPFTGIFIARISRGRTLREMILGSLFIPALGSFFWFSTFGTSAFELIHRMPEYQDEFGSVFSSIFIFFDHYPLSGVTGLVAVLLIISFLVTSADSAIFVLSMFSNEGNQDPKKSHRLVWAILMLFLTEAMLILGSYSGALNILDAMQKLLIITSLPFAFLTVLIGGKLVRDFRKST